MMSFKFFGNNGKGEEENRNIALMARNKLNHIVKVISKAPIDFDISHDEFTLVINEEENYLRLKKASEQKTVSWVILKGID